MDSSTGAHIGSTQRPTAKYSKLTNSLRVLTTGSMQCSMFCGGKGCKYDNPSKWSEDQMAIKGLFSHWYVSVIPSFGLMLKCILIFKIILFVLKQEKKYNCSNCFKAAIFTLYLNVLVVVYR